LILYQILLRGRTSILNTEPCVLKAFDVFQIECFSDGYGWMVVQNLMNKANILLKY